MVAAGSGAGADPAELGAVPRVSGESDEGAAVDLVRARTALLTPPPGARRLGPAALREALVELHDFWLATRAAAVGVGEGSGIALVAVGALGRRELAPWSDLDLVLVHDGTGRQKGADQVARIADALWYPLWDAGIGLDHSVRTVGEAVGVATEDLRVALGLLEVRLLAGDAELAERLAGSARQAWRAGIRGRFDELEEATRGRWQRSGEVAHRVEPDLKNGRGGLRDVQLLDALAAAQLVDRPAVDVRSARGLMLDLRTELHRRAGRARDVLQAEDAHELAGIPDLGVTDRYDLARSLSGAARTVVYATDVALRSARAALPRRGLAALRRTPARRPLDEGVVEHGGEVVLAREAQVTRDPALVLRLAAVAARTGLPIAAGTLNRLAEAAPELREPWPRSARTELLALLGAGEGLVDVIEALDRTGLWGRLVPEWGAVRDLPPRDRQHVWTVDRHLVEVTRRAGALTTRVSRPDLLLLGALIHDIGKGRDEDHSVVGAELARHIGRRLGLWPADVELLAAMVRHHLLLPHTSQRRDPEDPATVQRVVDTLDGDPVLLELLHALAEADALGTGPGVWTPWRATLMGDLVRRCRIVMAGEPVPGPEPLSEDRLALARSVQVSGRPEVSVDAGDELTTVTMTVAAPDRPGLLSRAAGVLALHSLQVHAAVLVEHDGVAVDSFTVSPRFGRLPEASLLREDLVRVLQGSLDLPARLAAKERDYSGRGSSTTPPASRVLWFDDEATGAVVLELRTADRIGLLHHVAAALEAQGVDVRWARVSTLGSSVIDAFCLEATTEAAQDGTPHDGPGNGTVVALDPTRRRAIEAAVMAAAQPGG
ncbi:[protein-PII] uridylyltransferase [Actinomycetospora sp. TBRC 11914]|uniref:[protein-PII] uridylyltransferase n=1 Tax=Actinomycetospora sp. TBRC 11914 TaxID=2729387 RepID=UPI00145CCF7F|nr:[protein-PII] uridylyltransferase [Actinomycetospora sp. TBRC 11914]NMO90031.1 [protein-PII] uridylyltransferase [Actinomycetospora sp. TBRC 11914]